MMDGQQRPALPDRVQAQAGAEVGRAREAAGPSAERSRPWAELGSRAEYTVNENFVFSIFPEAF